MNHEQDARTFFRGREKLNCAQAVARAFQDDLNVSDKTIAAMAGSGGGRAEGGLCGALHAVRQLVSDDEIKEEIENEFLAAVGTLKCREIRSDRKIDCRNCVGLAARLLSERVDRVRES